MSDSSVPSEQSGTQAFPIVVSATPVEPPASTDLTAPEHRPPALTLAEELGYDQQRVLQEMGSGSSITEASKTTGVSCRTISRWLNENPKFIAAYNAWKAERLEAGHASALAMTDDIMGNLRNALKRGDEKISLRMALHMGMLKVSKPGSTDAEELRRQQAVSKAKRDKELWEEEFELGLRALGSLNKDGIIWTKEAKARLSYEEQTLLEFLREKAAGRDQRDCFEFSPLDHDRHLTDWERGVLTKARQKAVLEGNIIFHGHVLPVPRGTNGTLIHYSKRNMFNMLRKGGASEEEAMQLLANYRRPYPGFYEPDDLPYAEDEQEGGDVAAPASEPAGSPESESPATNA